LTKTFKIWQALCRGWKSSISQKTAQQNAGFFYLAECFFFVAFFLLKGKKGIKF